MCDISFGVNYLYQVPHNIVITRPDIIIRTSVGKYPVSVVVAKLLCNYFPVPIILLLIPSIDHSVSLPLQ